MKHVRQNDAILVRWVRNRESRVVAIPHRTNQSQGHTTKEGCAANMEIHIPRALGTIATAADFQSPYPPPVNGRKYLKEPAHSNLGRRSRVDDIVPVTVEVGALDAEGVDLVVGDLDAGRVRVGV
jgi:hypothetical protein